MQHKEYADWAAEALSEAEGFHCSSMAPFLGTRKPAETWAYGPSVNRDSNMLAESNWDTAVKRLEESKDDSNWVIESAGHWACGWVKFIRFRPFDKDGNPTAAGKVLQEISEALEYYPALDEEDLSRREYDEERRAVTDAVQHLADQFYQNGKLVTNTDDLYEEVHRWLADSQEGSSALDFNWNEGCFIPEELVTEAIEALGYEWVAEDASWLPSEKEALEKRAKDVFEQLAADLGGCCTADIDSAVERFMEQACSDGGRFHYWKYPEQMTSRGEMISFLKG